MMRKVFVLALAAAGASAARPGPASNTAATVLEAGNMKNQHTKTLLAMQGNEAEAFEAFMKEWAYEFEGEEKAARFAAFTQNIKFAIERNELDVEAQHGITQFSHLTPEEFKAIYFPTTVDPKEYRKGFPEGETLPTDNLPDDYDWRDHGAVTPVKNQGQCGSCWSFSATGGIEGATVVAGKPLPTLSEQHLVDCDHNCYQNDPANGCDSGCNGGLPINAMNYVIENGGIDTEESYPYEAFDGQCRNTTGTIGATVSNATIVPSDEDQMAAYMVEYGPLSIGIDALWMQSYQGGVSCPYLCNKQALDHGVLIVGYGKKGFTPTHLDESPFWTIKNSWGPAWGESGFIRMCRGKNMCGINEMVVSVTSI